MECDFDKGVQVGGGTWRKPGEAGNISSIQEETTGVEGIEASSHGQSQGEIQSSTAPLQEGEGEGEGDGEGEGEGGRARHDSLASNDNEEEARLRNASIDIFPVRKPSTDIDFRGNASGGRGGSEREGGLKPPYPPPTVDSTKQSRDRNNDGFSPDN